VANQKPRQRRARGSIDPDKILDGAFEVARRDGLENLSMPALAGHLDVGVTSIYWYYRNKDELLRRMSGRAITQLFERFPSPEGYAAADWRAFLHEYFTVQLELHEPEDVMTEMTMLRTSAYSMRATHAVYHGIEEVLAFLVRAGFSHRHAWNVWSTCSMYTRGFIIAEYNRRKNGTPPEGLLQLGLLDAETMPILTELVRSDPSTVIDGSGETNFEFGLGALLDIAESLWQADSTAAAVAAE